MGLPATSASSEMLSACLRASAYADRKNHTCWKRVQIRFRPIRHFRSVQFWIKRRPSLGSDSEIKRGYSIGGLLLPVGAFVKRL